MDEREGYQIEMLEDGVILRGSIKRSHFPTLVKMAEELGFDIIDVGLAQAFNATMVITNDTGSAKLRQEKRNLDQKTCEMCDHISCTATYCNDKDEETDWDSPACERFIPYRRMHELSKSRGDNKNE